MLPWSSSRHEWYHSHQIVSPSLRLLRVRPVVRGSSPLMRRVRSSATAPRSASCSKRIAVERHAQDFLGAPAEEVLGLRRPAHEAEIAIPLEHRERRVVDVRRQHPVGAAQRVLVALLVVHVGVHGVDADDAAFGVAVRRVVDRFPALLADRLREQLLDGDGLALQHALEQRAHLREPLVADDVGHRAARELVALQPEPFLVVAVQEPVVIVAIDVRDARRHVVHDEPQLRLGRAQRFLRLLQSVDVVHQHERARHVARRRRIGNHADRHPARLAVGAGNEAVEFRRLAVERAGDDRLRAFEDGRADDVAQPQRRDLVRVDAEVLQQRPVDVLAALGAIDVGDRRRHAVHDRAQLALARRQRVLRDLEVGDVVQHDVDALDRAVDPVVRAPSGRGSSASGPTRRRARARSSRFRRRTRGPGTASAPRRVLEADHFGRGLADDRRAVEAVELQERVVDEA